MLYCTVWLVNFENILILFCVFNHLKCLRFGDSLGKFVSSCLILCLDILSSSFLQWMNDQMKKSLKVILPKFVGWGLWYNEFGYKLQIFCVTDGNKSN